MAHKHPEQIRRLIGALAHEDADFYIHLDKRSDAMIFSTLGRLPRVQFVRKRLATRWASHQFTEASVQGFREILATGVQYDFINLLSGQDYPIKPVNTIHRFLSENIGHSFLSFEREGSDWWKIAAGRVELYHSHYFEFKGQFRVQRLVSNLLPKRKFPLSYTLYGGPGGAWWTMSAECAAYVVQFMDEHPGVNWFGRFTFCSDEFMIHTILMNSPLKDQIINDNCRFMDWSQGLPNPKTLTLADVEKLTHSDKLFARKFDTAQDAEVLDVIDQVLLRAEPM
jgi:hypothetical protein